MQFGRKAASSLSSVAARYHSLPALPRYAAAAAWIGLAVAIASWRDSTVAQEAISAASAAIEDLGAPSQLAGSLVFLFWSAVPVPLYAATSAIERKVEPRLWLGLPFFMLCVFGNLSPEESRALLSSDAANAYNTLLAATLYVLTGGLVCYGLFRRPSGSWATSAMLASLARVDCAAVLTTASSRRAGIKNLLGGSWRPFMPKHVRWAEQPFATLKPAELVSAVGLAYSDSEHRISRSRRHD